MTTLPPVPLHYLPINPVTFPTLLMLTRCTATAGAPAASALSPPASNLGLPTQAEIQAKIPPEGINIKILLDKFPGRVKDSEKVEFQAIVKRSSRFDRVRKLLLPL